MLLTVNAGSSSVRLVVYTQEAGSLELHAQHRWEGPIADTDGVLGAFLERHGIERIDRVAHRVVHGGDRGPGAHPVDDALEQAIADLAPLAPLHNPAALTWIRTCRRVLGDCPQLAVFDTGFYADLPEVARSYALPAALAQRHRLRRYGFHGLAHEAMLRHWTAFSGQHGHHRVISLQLGSGCSITASRDGHAVDTSMGFSPLEGLVMATRCGDLDPGLILHLLQSRAIDAETLAQTLNKQSGLLGVSGISGDMRELLASSDPRAGLAVALFAYRARKYLGAYLAALGGADAIVFGGGIGENAPEVRSAILDGMQWAGIALDASANAAACGGDARISSPESAVTVLVTAVDEARGLASAAQRVGHPMDTESTTP